MARFEFLEVHPAKLLPRDTDFIKRSVGSPEKKLKILTYYASKLESRIMGSKRTTVVRYQEPDRARILQLFHGDTDTLSPRFG